MVVAVRVTHELCGAQGQLTIRGDQSVAQQLDFHKMSRLHQPAGVRSSAAAAAGGEGFESAPVGIGGCPSLAVRGSIRLLKDVHACCRFTT